MRSSGIDPRNTFKFLDGRKVPYMSDFWMGMLAAQKAADGTKSVDRHHRILSIVGGIALALLIGGGLVIAAALNG
jgi:hypothetical protein